MSQTNRWNRMIYSLWAPIYDATVNRVFLPGRQRTLALLALKPGERVLLVGVGTGADLPLLPEGVCAVGIDYSPAMLAKARRKCSDRRMQVLLVQGDAQTSLVQDASFDAVILNLILSVVPDGHACLQAALKALKPGGRAVVFDKFLADGAQVSLVRRVINGFSSLLGTDITRRFGDLATGCACSILHDEASIFQGNYRVLLLEKRSSTTQRRDAG